MSKLSVVQARNAVIIALILGLVFSLVQIGFDLRNERDSLDHQVSRMLETIKAPASRAVFNVDRGLAENVVDSLLKFLPIYHASLTDDFGDVLASRDKPQTVARYPLLADILPVYRSSYSLDLTSKQTGRNLGRIDIKVFGDQIIENFVERSFLVIIFGTLRNFLLAVALTLIFHYTLTKPLTTLTGQLSKRTSSDTGIDLVEIPSGHQNDELGDLADKLNFYLKTTTELFQELAAAESRARVSETKFRNLAEASSDWFWEMGPDLKFVAQETYPEVVMNSFGGRPPVGVTRWEAVKDILPAFEKEDSEKWAQHFSDLASHKPFRNFQYAVMKPDGELSHIRIGGMPIFDKAGEFAGYQGTAFDFTLEAISNRALEVSEARYRAIFNNAQLGISQSTMSDGKIVQANERAAEILGYKSAEDLIKNYVGADAWIVADQREKMTSVAQEEGYVQEVQAEIRCPDGSRRWIRSSISTDFEEGLINSFFVDATETVQSLDELAKLNNELEVRVANRTRALRDEIFERKRAEDDHRASEARLLTAIEAIADGFLLFDANDKLVLANSRILEYSADLASSFVPGRTFEDICRDALDHGFFPEANDQQEEWLAKLLDQRKQAKHSTREIRTDDGRWLRLTDSPTPDGGMVGLRTDITELKQAHEDLQAANANLTQNERLAALGQLAATVSHELRNPMGAMQSSAYYLRHQMKDAGEKEQQALERIERNIQRCDRIIDELLDFTRIRELNLAELDFNNWLRETISELAVPDGVILEKEITADAPNITLDEEYFRRVVINLFENACQAMTKMEGSEALTTRRLAITTTSDQDHLCLIFRDTGVGMAADVLSRIFEPMFSTKGFGVGLGLAMVRQIIERHNGEITVVSAPGKGSEFTVRLPRSQE
jgi:PAS domain S-box-containing protein